MSLDHTETTLPPAAGLALYGHADRLLGHVCLHRGVPDRPAAGPGLFQRGGRADDLGALPGGHCVPAPAGGLCRPAPGIPPQAYRLPVHAPLPGGERLVLARPGHGAGGDRPGVGGHRRAGGVLLPPHGRHGHPVHQRRRPHPLQPGPGTGLPGLRSDLCVPGLPGGALRGGEHAAHPCGAGRGGDRPGGHLPALPGQAPRPRCGGAEATVGPGPAAVQSVLYPDAGRGAAEPDGGAPPVQLPGERGHQPGRHRRRSGPCHVCDGGLRAAHRLSLSTAAPPVWQRAAAGAQRRIRHPQGRGAAVYLQLRRRPAGPAPATAGLRPVHPGVGLLCQ